MKNLQINTILQILALLFLLIIGYLIFNSSANWKFITSELDEAKKELKLSKDAIKNTKAALEEAKNEFMKMKVQKDLIIHKRDSLILSFKRQNAKDWDELQHIKDSIKITNDRLTKDRVVLDGLFGLNK